MESKKPLKGGSDGGEKAGRADAVPAEKKVRKSRKKKKKERGYSRGVETMFRSSYRVQMDLSALADAKANIMITINGLILSIILASISPKIDANPWLLLPTIVVLVTCVVSIVYAVLAAMPRVSSGVVTMDDFRQNRASVLFFGNFASMPRQSFGEIMDEMLDTPEMLYNNMITDIYGIGSVLKRKFVLLRVAYGTFMMGIIASVLLFIGTFAITVFSVPG